MNAFEATSLHTEIGTELSYLKNICTEIKAKILEEGGRKFIEGGTSFATGAAETSLEFSLEKERFILHISTRGKRELNEEKRTNGFFIKRTENYQHLFLEIEFSLEGNIPPEVLYSIKARNISANERKKRLSWSYFLNYERKESSELNKKEMTTLFISAMEREKGNIVTLTRNVLQDFFTLKEKEIEQERLAAK